MPPEHGLAVVTGAASGIGRATAIRFVRRGLRVIIADRDMAGASRVAVEASTFETPCEALEVDVTSEDSVEAFSAAVLDRGAPTVLVNNAGWNRNLPFLEGDAELWDRLLAVNLLGVIRVTHSLLPALLDATGFRAVVNVASDAGRVGSSGDAVYSAAKGGVIAFTKALAREIAAAGVLANCVCPGPTDTPLFAAQPDRMRAALLRTIPMRRLADPDDVAAVIAMLGSSDASFVTGQVISVNGGATMAG